MATVGLMAPPVRVLSCAAAHSVMLRLAVRVIVASILLAGLPVGSRAEDEAPMPASPALPLAVTVEHGLVAVNVHEALLVDVLHAIGEQAGVLVTIHSGVGDRVTESFDGVALEEAIRRLARGYDVVLLYGASMSRAATGRLVEVRVYEASALPGPAVVDPRQQQARLQAVRNLIQQAHQRQPGALRSLAGMLASDPDPFVRRRVVAGLSGFRDEEAVAAMTSAVGDQDPVVRAAAVSAIGARRDETLEPTVAQILARDPDANVRRAAVWALSTLRSADVDRALQAAAADPDATVRQAAASALKVREQRARASAN